MKGPVYGAGTPLFSTADENATLNPVTAAKEFAGGAVVGGVLGGAQMGIANAAQRMGGRGSAADALNTLETVDSAFIRDAGQRPGETSASFQGPGTIESRGGERVEAPLQIGTEHGMMDAGRTVTDHGEEAGQAGAVRREDKRDFIQRSLREVRECREGRNITFGFRKPLESGISGSAGSIQKELTAPGIPSLLIDVSLLKDRVDRRCIQCSSAQRSDPFLGVRTVCAMSCI